MKKNFLFSSWLFGLANSFSAPLLGLYIYIYSNILYTINFLLISSIFILVGYIIVGHLSFIWKQSIIYYRIGIFLFILFYLVIFVLNKDTPKYINIVGSLYGLAQGFYWSGWDIIFYRTPKKLNFFNKSTYLGFITSLLSPGVYGSILSIFHNSGYGILFVLTAVLLLFAQLFVEDVKIDSVKLNIRNSLLVINDNKTYRSTMISLALVSGVNYILGSLNVILLYTISKSYSNFTVLNYIFTSLSVFSVYLLRDRLIDRIRPYKLVLISSLTLVLSGIFVLLGLPLVYLVIYNVTSPLIYPIIDVINWNNMDRRFLMDYLVNRQVLLNTGRILSSVSEVFIAIFSPSQEVVSILPLVFIASVIFARSESQKQTVLEG